MSRMEGEDLDLVERSRAGDTDAFRALVDRHSGTVFRTAFRFTGNEATAEDVVQEAFLRAYRALRKFDGRSEVGTWLYRITVNCAMDVQRKEKRRSRRAPMEDGQELDELISSEPHPDRRAESSEIARALAAVLETLTPSERTAFTLRHMEQRPLKEVAELLGVRVNACKSTVFRAVSKVRAALEPLVERSHEATH